MRTNKNLEVKSKAWKHLFFLCALCVLCGLIGCENHWMKEATAHMHRHNFEWVTNSAVSTPTETIQTLACTTGCNTTRGTRTVSTISGSTQSLISSGGIITGGQPDEDGKLVIPSMIGGVNITTIGERAFIGGTFTNLIRDITSLEIGDGIETIGKDAFRHNLNLTNVKLPNTLLHIGETAFRNAENLPSITIPNSVLTIGDEAFAQCRVLTEITIPANVTYIGRSAFNVCYELRTVIMRPTTPPELGITPPGSITVFSSTHAELKIYVPSGYGDTYKAATGWTTLASKIEEMP